MHGSVPALADETASNTPATGAPTISGTAQVLETLTVNTSTIADEDGMTDVTLNYQWFANDGTGDRQVGSFTVPSYVVQSRDEGDKLWVQVWFTDDGGTTEFLNSEKTEAVTAADDPDVPDAPEITNLYPVSGGLLSVTWKMTLYPDGDGGSAITGYEVQWKEADDSWDTAEDVSKQSVTPTSVHGVYVVYNALISGLSEDASYSVRVLAKNAVGSSPYSGVVTATIPGDQTALTLSGITASNYLENGTDAVSTYATFGAGDGTTITWSLTGDDSGGFTISSSGVLSFSVAPDYENPSDDDEDNVYEVTVNATDGTNTGTLDVRITVTNEDEAPTLQLV